MDMDPYTIFPQFENPPSYKNELWPSQRVTMSALWSFAAGAVIFAMAAAVLPRYWLIASIAGLAAFITIYRHVNNDAGRKAHSRQVEEAQQKAEREASHLTQAVKQLYFRSAEIAESIPKRLQHAGSVLDKAEHEYTDQAFAPFWDAVEEAASTLVQLDDSAKQLAQNSRMYYGQLKGHRHTFPSFSVDIKKLPDPSTTTKRLEQLVRAAQKNFQFATIFEQRKTNAILGRGFLTLNSAINQLGGMLTESFDNLRIATTSHVSELIQAQTTAHADVVAQLKESHEDFSERAKEQRAHEARQLETVRDIHKELNER